MQYTQLLFFLSQEINFTGKTRHDRNSRNLANMDSSDDDDAPKLVTVLTPWA